MSARAPCIRASGWRPLTQNTLRGFCTLQLPSGLVLHGVSVHQEGDKRWIGLPGRPQTDGDGNVRRNPSTGKTLYSPVVEIEGKARREAFQAQALAAVDALVATGVGGDDA